jgi:AraC family transcriptional regulator
VSEGTVEQLVFAGDRVVLGEFHCSPGDPRWSHENLTDEGHFVVFPGTTVVIERGEDAVVATPNHVIFYDRDQAYRRRLVDPHGDHCVFLIVDEALLAELAGKPGHRFSFPVGHGPVDPATYLLHRLLLRAARARETDRLLVEEALYRIVSDAVGSGLRLAGVRGRRPERPGTARAHTELVEATKELVARRLHERLTLGEIAQTVHSSPFHLARVFRDRTGFSIHGYRNQLRLRSSLDALFEPGVDLALLARRLGYSSHSHFTDAFRRAFGSPPSAVRRAGRSGDLGELRTILEAPLAAAS